MAKSATRPISELLRWSEYLPTTDVTDPLGLGLRGSTRLASLLMYCVTSITPRARYFSFLPWCIKNFEDTEKNQKYALGLREAIKIREKSLTYGCVAHHERQPCDGGSLVGSTSAQKWFEGGKTTANLKQLPFAKNPALDAYFNSLVNLGFFKELDSLEVSEETLAPVEFTFENLELSDLGREVAETYNSVVGRLGAVKALSQRERTCSVSLLKELGRRGGLCELSEQSAPDRALLEDIFFARKGISDKSHFRRNRSLVLILELSSQFKSGGWLTNSLNFGMSVYYGQLVEGRDVKKIAIPSTLTDIADRWRMFYFHHYMGVALEGMFSWLTNQLCERGVAGATLSELAAQLNSAATDKALGELTMLALPRGFGKRSPAEFFEAVGIAASCLSPQVSRKIDRLITPKHQIAEVALERVIRRGEYRQSPIGLAVCCILFALTIARFKRWEDTDYGKWLSSNAVVRDPYLDLLPSTVAISLYRNRENWWQQPWSELAHYVLSRFIVQQHQTMAFEKTAMGDRCLIEVDGERVLSDRTFDKIGLGNPRLGSAIQVLTDLGLLAREENGSHYPTRGGLKVLRAELHREAPNEVS